MGYYRYLFLYKKEIKGEKRLYMLVFERIVCFVLKGFTLLFTCFRKSAKKECSIYN